MKYGTAHWDMVMTQVEKKITLSSYPFLMKILADLKPRKQEGEFIIVDYAVSWITILLLGVGNWLFVAFVAIRLYAISRVNINSYNNYVTASANEVDTQERSKPSYVCG